MARLLVAHDNPRAYATTALLALSPSKGQGRARRPRSQALRSPADDDELHVAGLQFASLQLGRLAFLN